MSTQSIAVYAVILIGCIVGLVFENRRTRSMPREVLDRNRRVIARGWQLVAGAMGLWFSVILVWGLLAGDPALIIVAILGLAVVAISIFTTERQQRRREAGSDGHDWVGLAVNLGIVAFVVGFLVVMTILA